MKTLFSILFTLALCLSTSAQSHVDEINVLQTDTLAQASASSTYSTNYSPAHTVNAERTGINWNSPDGFGNGWNSGNSDRYGSPYLVYQFSRMYRITSVVVVGLQSNFTSPVEPTDTMETVYFNPDVKLEASGNCQEYAEVGHVTGNNKVVVKFPIPSGYMAKCLRLVFNSASAPQGFARVVEVSTYAKQ